MEFDEQGAAIRGTYPVSTVRLGAWKEDGTAVPIVETAVCDTCGNWATDICVTGYASADHPDSPGIMDARISRRTEVVVYACPEHYEAIVDALVNEHGHASNRYEPDNLTLELQKRMIAWFRADDTPGPEPANDSEE